MKKIYLVKKDPAKEGQDNWIIMNGYEFVRFIKTPEGAARKNNFGQLDSCGNGDDILVVECGVSTAKTWRAEKDNHDYLKKCEEESGLATFSYSSICSEEGEISGEEMLADSECDVEEYVVRQIQRGFAREAVKELDDLHRCIIVCSYLHTPIMTETEIANKLGISQQLVHYHKVVALRMLKKIMGN